MEGAPSSTYRLQLHAGFTFGDAAQLTDYLAQLGIAAIYTSPYTRAERGSTHGYNVVDHATINPEVGSADDHARMVANLREHRLGHILDFVPNHVGVGSGENRWWVDVLENGPASLFADYFDIDWHPPTVGLENRVLLPVLGQQFGAELEDGKLSIVFDAERGSFAVAYYDHRWPVAPRCSARILDLALESVQLAKDDLRLQELHSIRTAISHIPLASETASERREERAREKEVVKRRLAELCASCPEVRTAIELALAAKNPNSDNHGDIEWLDAMLTDQNYRLAYWRVATEEVNYRRFFDINELAAIRMEDPRVFDATHGLLLDLVARGDVTGLRLDHTDGLYEPQAYFRQLQERVRAAVTAANRELRGDLYVLAEKILEPGEVLPRSWRIAGTTGYDFLGIVNGLWVDASAAQQMTDVYCRITGTPAEFAPFVFEAKRLILETTFSAEIITLGRALRRLAETDRHSRDFTLTALTTAIKDTLAAFPVYRTYIAPGGSREPTDEHHVNHAVELAKKKNRALDPSVFDYLRDILLLRNPSPEAAHIAMRFQQLSGPVMAKGVEDTAYYRYHRLVSLDEVGCDPARFGSSIDDLHAHNAATIAAFPLTMTTTTTHDTKRSEDVRTRIAVLSEIPDEWETRVMRWLDRARRYGSTTGPSDNDRYLLFQTLVGMWPFTAEDPSLRDRITTYMTKAIREAKLVTSWTHPDESYEQAVVATIAGVLDDRELVEDLADFARSLAPYGACNSLAQVAIKLASPGVPDIYQGTEVWDISLVDPDNRRPVDYAHRRALLASLGEPSPALAKELLESFADGRIKLHVTRTGLVHRRADPLLFLEGSYRPLSAGPHAIAFERARGNAKMICIAPRLPRTLTRGNSPWPLGEVWGDTRVEVGMSTVWRNALTGERFEGATFALRDVLATFPIAWLIAE
ncbi:MAG: malto-oligosyltrehalose synthase [Deltaproteobacteria bacterium]|nr:malto-oligosyltrehalose synthase [Deltaproteobacteria bacterium]